MSWKKKLELHFEHVKPAYPNSHSHKPFNRQVPPFKQDKFLPTLHPITINKEKNTPF
jgi:hypothetical protein